MEEGRGPSAARGWRETRPRECGSALWWPDRGPAPIGTLKSAKKDKEGEGLSIADVTGERGALDSRERERDRRCHPSKET